MYMYLYRKGLYCRGEGLLQVNLIVTIIYLHVRIYVAVLMTYLLMLSSSSVKFIWYPVLDGFVLVIRFIRETYLRFYIILPKGIMG